MNHCNQKTVLSEAWYISKVYCIGRNFSNVSEDTLGNQQK